MKKNLLFLITLLFCNILINAQNIYGTFQTYLPYNNFSSVAISENEVFAATTSGIMVVNKNNEEISVLSKLEGLSDVNISKIKYDDETKTLIIGYEDGNIDLIKNDQIKNIPEIKLKQLTGAKNIQNIITKNKIAYLCTPFGVSLLDLNTGLFIETWISTINSETYSVKSLAFFEDSIFIATDKGLFSIANNNRNKVDFSQWHYANEIGKISFTLLQPFNNKLFTVAKDINKDNYPHIFYVLENNVWSINTTLTDTYTYVVDLETNNSEFLIADYNIFFVYDDNLNVLWTYFTGDESFFIHQILFSENNFWLASEQGLFIIYRQYFDKKQLLYNSVGAIGAEKIVCKNGIIAVVPGSLMEFAWHFEYPVLSILKNGKWVVIDKAFRDANSNSRALCNVVFNPDDDNDFFISSWGSGLYHVKDNQIVDNFTDKNSPLEAMSVDTSKHYVNVSGLSYDSYNNLWIANSSIKSKSFLKVLKNDGTWTTITMRAYGVAKDNDIQHILIDKNNKKWLTFPRDNKLIVFDDNNTIDFLNDDKEVSIDINGANENDDVRASTITTIAEDRDGYIWLGTDRGIKVIYTPLAVFTQTVYPHAILVEQMGYYQYLLQFEEITAIAVDGANQKWIGTSKAGVFLVSSDGTKELKHFTVDNSPLLSNQITSLCINNKTGEVFIGTASGIVSYIGNATFGSENYDDMKIFPNPIRENYAGVLTVSDLIEDSFCKIIDAAGSLVWQGYAKGGTLTWDCKDFYGNKPATGVYYINASDKSGKIKKTGKFLFIN